MHKTDKNDYGWRLTGVVRWQSPDTVGPALPPIPDSGVQEFTALVSTDSAIPETAVCDPIIMAFPNVTNCQVVEQSLAEQSPIASESGRRLLQQTVVRFQVTYFLSIHGILRCQLLHVSFLMEHMGY